MRAELAPEGTAFGDVVGTALDDAGGIETARAIDGGLRERAEIEELLGRLGVWDLDAPQGGIELEAAAAVCRAAGRNATPYPVAERLAAGPSGPRSAVAVVGRGAGRVQHADLPLTWRVADGRGRTAPLLRADAPLGGKLGRFVCHVEVGEWSVAAADPAALVLVLQAWTLLGMTEQAFELTRRHVRNRQQFGQQLAQFQTVQFALTDQVVANQGLAELAKYALWSVGAGRAAAMVDALALRTAALEAAETVFRVSHQLHGASGFCDETPISWLSRYSQPLRRLPWGRTQGERELVDRLEHEPLDGPFAYPGVAG